MEQSILQLLLGPTGVAVGAVLVAAGLIKAALYLHRGWMDESKARLEDQKQYLEIVEAERDFHVESQKLIARAILIMEKMEDQLRGGS